MGCSLGGSVCPYGLGVVFIDADDSRYRYVSGLITPNLGYSTDLAVFTPPDEVGLSSAAAHLVNFLRTSVIYLLQGHVTVTHESTDGDRICVSLTARGALDREGVPKRTVLCVFGPQVGDPGSQSADGTRLNKMTRHPPVQLGRQRECEHFGVSVSTIQTRSREKTHGGVLFIKAIRAVSI
jgi:hypothetical protein